LEEADLEWIPDPNLYVELESKQFSLLKYLELEVLHNSKELPNTGQYQDQAAH
jgi:hypothetical protein